MDGRSGSITLDSSRRMLSGRERLFWFELGFVVQETAARTARNSAQQSVHGVGMHPTFTIQHELVAFITVVAMKWTAI